MRPYIALLFAVLLSSCNRDAPRKVLELLNIGYDTTVIRLNDSITFFSVHNDNNVLQCYFLTSYGTLDGQYIYFYPWGDIQIIECYDKGEILYKEEFYYNNAKLDSSVIKLNEEYVYKPISWTKYNDGCPTNSHNYFRIVPRGPALSDTVFIEGYCNDTILLQPGNLVNHIFYPISSQLMLEDRYPLDTPSFGDGFLIKKFTAQITIPLESLPTEKKWSEKKTILINHYLFRMNQ